MSDKLQDPRRVLRRLNIAGFSLVAVLLGGIGGWAATSELAGAVIAPGTLVVESTVKKVQHSIGGIVSEILVKEGDAVQAGQVVMRLDATVTRSTLGVLRTQLDEAMVREARLLAERDDLDAVAFPQAVLARRDDNNIAGAMHSETRLFTSRRSGHVGKTSQLRERVAQSNEEIRGLSAQQDAKEREIALVTEELTGVTALWDKSLVSIQRLMLLRRDKARLEGNRGQHVADIARVRGKITEIELQIIQIEQDFRSEVLKDLRETQGKIAELREKLVAAEDELRRVDIRAPQSGIVHQLAVHTVGGVVANGETIMLIVPVSDSLLVEAKVMPQDIDQLELGAAATVRIMAGNQRTMPEVTATLTHISADLTREQPTDGRSGSVYYVVRLALSEQALSQLTQIRLIPGMPVDAFIQTHSRTPLEYLVKPLSDQVARTFRER